MKRDSCLLQKTLHPIAHKACGVQEKFDVVFAVDASNQNVMINQIAGFVRAFMRSFTLSKDRTRFGMLLYDSDSVSDILSLEMGVTAGSVENALTSIRTLGGQRGLHRLPDYVMRMFFTPASRRSGAKRILVVMTTGFNENSAQSEAFDQEAVNIFKEMRSPSSGVDVVTMVIDNKEFQTRASDVMSDPKDVILMQNTLGFPRYLGDLEQIVGYKRGIYVL